MHNNLQQNVETKQHCAHCGDVCESNNFTIDNSVFCCNGCKMVYQLLGESGMSAYYLYEKQPGISQKDLVSDGYDYLDDAKIVAKLLEFQEGNISKITLHLPDIHCSACLWLLENISKLDAGIIQSRVNFTTKKATITFRHEDTSLRNVVALLTKIGYAPRINYDSLDGNVHEHKYDKKLLYKLGLAGFSFGNIMLLSFPEYLGFDKASYLFHIGYINIILALPVLFYSGIDYIKSAYTGIKIKSLNIDLPIAIGMITLFFRSVYEILGHQGEGYLDSFTGFVFFLLIGRWFQSFTYQALDFDRNYKSYFPISAAVKSGTEWITKSIDQLAPNDIIRIRNQELIPADGELLKGKARIDYSFVTGESDLISKTVGEALFAGGKHQGESIEVIIKKNVDQSYLTQLWNEDTFKERGASDSSKLIAFISKYFTYVVIAIALLTMTFWWMKDVGMAFNTFTAVLIVACPCALALAIPFTYGNILRLLSRGGFYLRNVGTIEDIQDIDHIIFDKTGTLTDSSEIEITYHGKPLSLDQESILKSACSHSSHPLSKAIVKKLSHATLIDVDSYEDVIGSGFVATCEGKKLKIGSSSFIFGIESSRKEHGVFIELDNEYMGYFKFEHSLRENIHEIINGLQNSFQISVLSGDTDQEQDRIRALFKKEHHIYFNQRPKDKLDKIKELQNRGQRVMMIGDGLNDAGALKQANVGIVISDKSNNFSPACDGILDANKFGSLLQQLKYLRMSKYIIYGAFVLAFIYNGIGLTFAVTGHLSPVVAAILMPLSSITVIVYGVLMSFLAFKYVLEDVEKKR
ncbi:MAG: heavy metal translocating P-type ATPase metal-binding domain-containing protein [Saprospiraceae bacterium]|nr:heavy metal translocating P-type ATPase metal-binding domain-containing protein [Saprospiraceae bacterium]